MIAGEIPEVEEILPLAPAQAGMLLELTRGDAPEGAYLGVVRFTLDGPLDPQAFADALRATAAARDVFRLSFEWEGLKQPVQLLHPQADLPVTIEDWTGRQEAEIAQRAEQERARGCDLRHAPLSRAVLLRLAPDRHVCLLVLHHLICDGWSARILLQEVMARLAGQPVLAAPPFRDLLAWQASRDDSGEEAFFRDYLAGLAPPVPVAIPAGVPSGPRARIDVRRLPVDPALDRAVGTLARHLRVTPPAVFSALLAVQLRRFGAGDDVVFGQTASGRPQDLAGADTMVGPFVSTLPTRLRIDPRAPVAELIRQAGAHAQARRPFETAALRDVMRWSGLGAGVPLYHTLFVYQGLPPVPPQGAEPRLSDLSTDVTSPDAMALLYHPGAAPALDLHVNRQVHDPDAAEAFARDYLDLVAEAVKHPETPVAALARRIATAPTPEPAATVDFPPLPQAIAAHAARAPGAPALRCGDERMTYGALMAAAEGVAATLAGAGIGPGDIVPVAMARSTTCVAAMLGVMLRGAAYVVLDLSYPRAHLQGILDTVAAKAVLTRPEDEDLIAWTDLPRLHPGPGRGPAVPLTGEEIAYVLFTSGSQGRPKGVRVSHANLAYSTGVRRQVYGSDPSAFLILSPLGFDSSVAGLYWALASGGEAVLSPPEATRDLTALARLIRSTRPSHMLCLPGLYRHLLDTATPEDLAALHTVIVAGEPLPPSLIAAHRDRLGARLFNEYGPTEATVWCTAFDTAQHDGGDDVPIGRAIPGSRIAIADPDGAPLPDGTLGEIIVSGPGVAAGYLGTPDIDGGAFSGQWDARSYRTGDLGMRRPDGIVLYRGRCDTQVKIRGHRVELAEVEAALGALPDLGDRVVLAEDAPAGTRLVAVVQTGDPATIRATLAARLPAHMVPAEVRVIPDLPRLPNGKIDRRGLLDRRPAELPETSAPEGYVARQLAEIWEGLLNTDLIGPDDNFFDLGGDSLLAMRAVFAAEAAGLPLAAHEIFAYPVLSQLAAVVEARPAGQKITTDDGLLARLHPEGRSDPFLMIHGSPEMCAHLGHALGPDTPLWFQFSSYLRGPVPRGQDIAAMVAALKPLALRLFDGRPVRLGGYSLGAVLAIELARQLRDEGCKVPFVFLLDPSWECGGSHAPAARRVAHRAKSALLSRALDLGARLGVGDAERLRLSAVGHYYRAALLAYHPARYDGPVHLVMSRDGTALLDPGGWLAGTCPNRRDTRLEVNHFDLQHDTDALFAWTTLLTRMLQDEAEP
ncbi:amino acid adenylation domain-containing protein [Fluviibacterium sp. DFM31]|uniref:Amino acid adenylation domain-containing protein n=1 Tax=Meridianimarinicoccus marinus TaxID=3231483 RepID=A0ABV3L619_9RHOB